MKVFLFLWVKALITLVFALLLLIFPVVAAGWFGLELGPEGGLAIRLLGALLAGLALISYYGGVSESSLSARNTILSLAVSDTLASVLLLTGLINGILNEISILLIIISILFAAACWIYWVTGGRTV